MKLSARLNAVAAQVGPYRKVADIGSDHAYLPVWLAQAGKISSAVAGEIMPGPLAAAQRTIVDAAMEEKVVARLGDGLQILVPGEVEVAVLAGMGGKAIRGILERSPAVVEGLRRLVCQPMTGAPGLRSWLAANGWKIIAEELVLEDGKLYELLAAEHGTSSPSDALTLEIGPLLWERRHPLLLEQLARLKRQYERRAADMEKSKSVAVQKRRETCLEKINALEARMSCLQAVK